MKKRNESGYCKSSKVGVDWNFFIAILSLFAGIFCTMSPVPWALYVAGSIPVYIYFLIGLIVCNLTLDQSCAPQRSGEQV